MEHMLLQLQRSPEQEDAVRGLIDDLHNASSPKFHQWLTAEEFGRNYRARRRKMWTRSRRGWNRTASPST